MKVAMGGGGGRGKSGECESYPNMFITTPTHTLSPLMM